MSHALTCPSCAASFRPTADVRGKKLLCPTCGQPMIVTGAGIAKRDEGGPTAPALTPAGRSFPWGWLAAALLLSGAAVIGILLATRRPEPKEEEKPVATGPKGNAEAVGAADKLRPLSAPEPGTPPKLLPKQDSSPAVAPESPPTEKRPLLPNKGPLTLSGHTGGVSSVAFSPDGKTLASGSADKTVKLWDVASGANTRTLTGHTRWAASVTFSLNGKTLYSGSYDGTVRLWDVASGKNTNSFPVGEVMWAIALSPNGKTLASMCNGAAGIKLWDVASASNTDTLPANGPLSVAYSPDGNTLAVASAEGWIRLWELAGRTNTKTFTMNVEVWSVAWSPDGKTLASGSVDRTIRLWEVASGKNSATLTGHTGEVYSVAFSPDGKTLASGSVDRTIKLWDVTSGQTLATLKGHTGHIWCVAFSPDGKQLASGSNDTTIKLWDVAAAKSPKPSGK